MRKLFIFSLLIINSFNLVFAQEFVLSDRIREAREAAKREEIKEKVSNIQPINIKEELGVKRGKKLYDLDKKATIRFSHENPIIKKVYDDFFEKPNSHKAHELLHTDHTKK